MKSDKFKEMIKIVLKSLESGHAPWERSFNNMGFMTQTSGSTLNLYKGFNQIYLTIIAQEKGYKMNIWYTFNQISKLGGKIKAKEKHTKIVHYSSYVPKNVQNNDKLSDDEKKSRTAFFMKFHQVFNIEQTEGIDYELPTQTEVEDLKKAEEIIPDNCNINYGSFKTPHYIPKSDKINLPHKESFKSQQLYYATLFHELSHWTGHKSRLNRVGIEGDSPHGSETYAREELIAEMASSIINGKLGIRDEKTLGRSAQYLKGWGTAIKNDPNMFVKASTEVFKIINFLFGEENEK